MSPPGLDPIGQLVFLLQELADSLAANPPPDPDAAHRRDLTHQQVITIDDASTRDVDDGLAVEVLPDGGHRLWVHIADPSRWVGQGDPLDGEACRRAQTVYLPTGVLLTQQSAPFAANFVLIWAQCGTRSNAWDVALMRCTGRDPSLSSFVQVTAPWLFARSMSCNSAGNSSCQM